MSTPLPLTYVLPLRYSGEIDRKEMAQYLSDLTEWVDEVILVDGSPSDDFATTSASLPVGVQHVAPDHDLHFLNGKVDGVTTGIRRASNEKVVIADDDVRYRREHLVRLSALLDNSDLIRPQNHFVPPLPWHALLDTARTLLNRSLGADYPGTFGLRRSAFIALGGYDGNVMFENLELIRTFDAGRYRIDSPLDLYVPRLPPTSGRFFQQRVRQAYDEFALPGRLVAWLCVVPAVVVASVQRRFSAMASAVAAVIALAAIGRMRAGGSSVFPLRAVWWSPLWVLERGTSIWAAVGARLRGGVRYGGRRIRVAAHIRPVPPGSSSSRSSV